MQVARSWRQQASNLRLVGSRCNKCESLDFPERIRCSRCGATDLAEYRFCGRGTVHSYAEVLEAPAGFIEQVPYIAALIELEEGPFVSSMLADVNPSDVSVGLEVAMVTRRIGADGEEGPIIYAYKFSPLTRPDHGQQQ